MGLLFSGLLPGYPVPIRDKLHPLPIFLFCWGKQLSSLLSSTCSLCLSFFLRGSFCLSLFSPLLPFHLHNPLSKLCTPALCMCVCLSLTWRAFLPTKEICQGLRWPTANLVGPQTLMELISGHTILWMIAGTPKATLTEQLGNTLASISLFYTTHSSLALTDLPA